MIKNERKFIEAASYAARDAKSLLLPVLMVDHPDAPWSAPAIERLRDLRVDPIMQESVELVLAFELPFILEEERLAAAGITLGTDMAAFEVAMVTFERAFWSARFDDHQRDPSRFTLREVPIFDVCAKHHLDSDRVRRTIRDHAAVSFEAVAPLLGTSEDCSHCRLGITRLLTQEVRRGKGGRPTAVA
jgi:bacterioferritin-associated ferredoxin